MRTNPDYDQIRLDRANLKRIKRKYGDVRRILPTQEYPAVRTPAGDYYGWAAKAYLVSLVDRVQTRLADINPSGK